MKLRFVTGKDTVSRLIRLRAGWPTHVDAVLPDGGLLGAHFNGGVMIRHAGYDAGTIASELIVDVPAPDKVDDRFYKFLYSQLGKPYDWAAVLAIAAGRDWREAGHWYCSELQTRAEEMSGWFMPLPDPVSRITPRDLLMAIGSRVYIPRGATKWTT